MHVELKLNAGLYLQYSSAETDIKQHTVLIQILHYTTPSLISQRCHVAQYLWSNSWAARRGMHSAPATRVECVEGTRTAVPVRRLAPMIALSQLTGRHNSTDRCVVNVPLGAKHCQEGMTPCGGGRGEGRWSRGIQHLMPTRLVRIVAVYSCSKAYAIDKLHSKLLHEPRATQHTLNWLVWCKATETLHFVEQWIRNRCGTFSNS